MRQSRLFFDAATFVNCFAVCLDCRASQPLSPTASPWRWVYGMLAICHAIVFLMIFDLHNKFNKTGSKI